MRAGLVALTEKGFAATGIDEILKTVGVPKGSFYHYFESKEAFGRELIDRYVSRFAKRLERFFSDPSKSQLERLEAFSRDAETSMERFAFSRGCLVGNLGQEMGALPEPFRNQLSDGLITWQNLTAECLKAAQVGGEIDKKHDPDSLASFFWIGWEGAVLRAKLDRCSAPLKIFADGFLALCRS